ncbi:MAG: phosphate/phosphite/phosphonate ABC transporter substrate-binding protein [Betaproteobacteria bacterium]|jgi:phosphonate transport system substrate-binding protein|nr:phosphate/phosphite/phosphonate ABC transporter substrate-binding protein [Betaproteobacteria bacterium]
MFARLMVAAALAVSTAGAAAQDWRVKYPVVSMSAVSSESQGATEARFKDFAKVFRDRFGVDLRIFTASSYSGTIQALTAGQIQFANLGPAAYAAAFIDSDGGVEPLAAAKEIDGDVGYHSHLIVRADSPFRTIEDLKGRSLAWADPNSASGYLIPLVSLRAAGIDAMKHFGRTVFSGGHEQSALGVVGGQFDSAFVFGARDPLSRGVLHMMGQRGVLDTSRVRVVWRSPLIPGSPVTVRKDLPEDMKRDIQKLFVDLYSIDPRMAEIVARGKTQGYVPVTHAMYQPVIDAVQEQRRMRRKN